MGAGGVASSMQWLDMAGVLTGPWMVPWQKSGCLASISLNLQPGTHLIEVTFDTHVFVRVMCKLLQLVLYSTTCLT